MLLNNNFESQNVALSKRQVNWVDGGFCWVPSKNLVQKQSDNLFLGGIGGHLFELFFKLAISSPILLAIYLSGV